MAPELAGPFVGWRVEVAALAHNRRARVPGNDRAIVETPTFQVKETRRVRLIHRFGRDPLPLQVTVQQPTG
jgi:hypothetical protein